MTKAVSYELSFESKSSSVRSTTESAVTEPKRHTTIHTAYNSMMEIIIPTQEKRLR